MVSSYFVSAEKISEICLNPSFAPYLQIAKKSPQARAQKVAEPSQATSESLCFVSTPEHLAEALKGHPAILVAHNKLATQEIQISENQALFTTPNISAAMALILPYFDHKQSRFPVEIHPQASIDPSAKLGQNVRIGAFAVIGAQAEIGDDTIIGSHVVVETGAVVGAKSLLHPFVFVGAHCKIGKYCELHPHTTIGSDGFGFVQGHDKRRHKIPQLGIVVLEDFVEMGASCTIDRATLGETRIGEGTKFDNLCHVGHNCKIGKHNVFAGGFMIAGSSEIGDYCMVGGSTVVSDHVKLGSNIILGGRSAVTKDVPEAGAYSGYPLEPFRDNLKTLANFPHITGMRKQLAQIRKHLGLKDEDS